MHMSAQRSGWATGDWRHAAGGRRRYNARRRDAALIRRSLEVDLILRLGLLPWQRGTGICLAERLNVAPSTISRDLAAIFAAVGRPLHDCPTCGSRSLSLAEQVDLDDVLARIDLDDPWNLEDQPTGPADIDVAESVSSSNLAERLLSQLVADEARIGGARPLTRLLKTDAAAVTELIADGLSGLPGGAS
jgi:hypothetical protein